MLCWEMELGSNWTTLFVEVAELNKVGVTATGSNKGSAQRNHVFGGIEATYVAISQHSCRI